LTAMMLTSLSRRIHNHPTFLPTVMSDRASSTVATWQSGGECSTGSGPLIALSGWEGFLEVLATSSSYKEPASLGSSVVTNRALSLLTTTDAKDLPWRASDEVTLWAEARFMQNSLSLIRASWVSFWRSEGTQLGQHSRYSKYFIGRFAATWELRAMLVLAFFCISLPVPLLRFCAA